MRERRGFSDAHMGQEGGGHCCGLYQLPPAHTIPVPSHFVPARHFSWGWPPSPPPPWLLHCQLLLLSSSSFLPLIGPQMGTGSSCRPATSLLQAGAAGGGVKSPADRQAGFHPPL